MRYLCLAYGDGKDFQLMSNEQEIVFEQDELIRKSLMATVRPATTVHSANGKVVTRAGPLQWAKRQSPGSRSSTRGI
jgi:hypothetical protein